MPNHDNQVLAYELPINLLSYQPQRRYLLCSLLYCLFW